jgi:DNA-binding NarL/FixJ family response regulator
MAARALRVALFCRNPNLRKHIEAIVDTEPDLRWMGSLDGVGAVISLCGSDCPDVLVIDSRSDLDWKLCLVATGLFPDLAVVALLNDGSPHPVDAAWGLLHRTSGIVGVTARPDRLRVAVRGAVQFGRTGDPDTEVSMVPSPRGHGLRGKPLTARELEILQLIAEGLTAEKIGRRLSISAATVRTHIYRLLRKLNARDRAHAVALSFRMSLLSVHHSAGPPGYRFDRPN